MGVQVAARFPAEAHVNVGNRRVNKVGGILLQIVLRLGLGGRGMMLCRTNLGGAFEGEKGFALDLTNLPRRVVWRAIGEQIGVHRALKVLQIVDGFGVAISKGMI